jgi:hypothetical protein
MRCPAHTTTLSDSRCSRHPQATSRPLPSPQRVSPDYPHHPSSVLCPLPRRIVRVHVSIASPLTRPSPVLWRVGIRITAFEACSGFTHVTARWIAQPPKAAFVTRLQPARLPDQAARQLPDQSTTLRVAPSSTGDTRPRGAHNTIREQWNVAMTPSEPCSARRPGAAFLLREVHRSIPIDPDAAETRRGSRGRKPGFDLPDSPRNRERAWAAGPKSGAARQFQFPKSTDLGGRVKLCIQRNRDVRGGRHIPISAGAIPRFLNNSRLRTIVLARRTLFSPRQRRITGFFGFIISLTATGVSPGSCHSRCCSIRLIPVVSGPCREMGQSKLLRDMSGNSAPMFCT